MDSFDCDYCREDADNPASCPTCSDVFCREHVGDHNCQEDVAVIKLSNGTIYDMDVPDVTSTLYNKVDGDGLIGTFTRALAANPVTLAFLILMWVWFIFQFGWLIAFGHSSTWDAVFVLDSANISYFWTWVTSILSHGGLLHLVVNSVVLAMFGPIVEHHLGRRKYFFLILVGGVAAGLGQVGTAAVLNISTQAVGASGAIAAILGLYATVEPDMRVYFLGIIPMPLWFAAFALGVGSFVIAAQFGIVAFNIAHLAHGVGILFGVAFGITTDSEPIREYIQQKAF